MKAEDFKYTHYMTLEEWKKWKRNFDKGMHGKTTKYKEFLLKHDNFADVIECAFFWHATPKSQGWKYWNKISKRTKPVKQ